MAGFVYKLQSYLGVKEKIEEQKKLEYGKSLSKLEAERFEKNQLENKKSSTVEGFRKSITDGINPYALNGYNNYIGFVKKKIRDQEIVVQIAEKEAEKKRLELVEAMKERKMLDKLKEKAKDVYMKEQLHKEQKIVDEVVSYQYNKKAE